MLIRTYACVSATEEWVLPSKLHTTRKQLLSCTYLNNCTVQTSCNNFLSNCHFITSVIKEADESKKKLEKKLMTQICTKTTLVSKQAKDGIHTELFFYQKQRAQENVVNFSRQMTSS